MPAGVYTFTIEARSTGFTEAGVTEAIETTTVTWTLIDPCDIELALAQLESAEYEYTISDTAQTDLPLPEVTTGTGDPLPDNIAAFCSL